MVPQAFSTGSNGNNYDHDDKKDKKGGEDSNKFKDWKKENDHHDDDDEHDKVKVCHVPPGEPENAHTIEISESALPSHLDHGDSLGACPDDDSEEEEPANIIIIRAITDDNNKAYNIDDFTISIDGVVQDLGLPIPIVPKTDHIITGAVPDGYKFVLIAGDPSCPVNIDSDVFSLKKGQTIVCTIYYDDLFVEGGSVGPNPTITIVNNVATDPDKGAFDIIVSPVVGEPEINGLTTKYTVDSHTAVTISGSDNRPVLITGDGNCPENVGGFVNIENGQNITCIYSDRPLDTGTFFVRKSVQMYVQTSQLSEVNSPHGCSQVPDDVIRPCVTTKGDYLLLVDQDFEQNGAEFAIVIITLQPTNGEMRVGQCAGVIGVDEFTYPGINPVTVKGFLINCPGLADDGLFNLNYALSKTTLVPID